MNTWIVPILYLTCALFFAAGLVSGVRYAWEIHHYGLIQPPRLLIAAFVGVVVTAAIAGFVEAAAR